MRRTITSSILGEVKSDIVERKVIEMKYAIAKCVGGMNDEEAKNEKCPCYRSHKDAVNVRVSLLGHIN